ncbi:MAG: rod shape-determining protein MreD [Actinomycetes bacterium]
MAELPSSRVALAAGVLLVALAVQVTFLSRLPLPGATPDLVLVAVVAFGLAHGPGFGLVSGFGVGLATDLVPPADHAIGRWALVLCVIGYLAGLLRAESRSSALVPLVVVGVAAAASVLMYAGLGLLIEDANVSWPAATRLVPTAVLYDVVLSPFVVSAVLGLVRRVEADPTFRH